MRAVTSTSCWVSASSRSGALNTRSRIWWKDSVWVSSSRLAWAAATTTRVSRSRRSGSGSGTASSSFWRTLNACLRVTLALSTAAANGAVCGSPNSSTASTSSLALVRTALSTSTTIERDRSSSASMGTDASALGSVGSTRLAAATSASWRLRCGCRLHSISSADHQQPDAGEDQQRHPARCSPVPAAGRRLPSAPQPVGGRRRRTGPVACCAAPARSGRGGCRRPWSSCRRPRRGGTRKA